MDSFKNIPDYQKAEFMKYLEEQQLKDSLRMYNFLVESCFDRCVHSGWNGGLTSKQLTGAETECISHCAEKFMKLTQRVGFRLTEYQALQSTESSVK